MLKINDEETGISKEGRVLWLTDTYDDHNGVSMVLQAMHREIKTRNLPIDIMVCSKRLQSDSNLIVLKPISEFSIPLYRQQPLRIPNYLSIQRIFKKHKYDRIICSTEGPMGLAALYLKKIFNVKTYFYLHTDWLMFARQVMGLQDTSVKYLQRVMRMYYNMFDSIFVLNSDQQKWLTGNSMRFESSRILMTAHWAENTFTNLTKTNAEQADANLSSAVLLFAGRISREKGIFELPAIYRKAKEQIPGLSMIIAGTGPAEQELKAAFPEATYTGWVDHEKLPEIYAAADLLILPSRFDTFSCVVLEALSCGLPVIAYNTKGPKDIIQDSVCGYLAETAEDISARIVTYITDKTLRNTFKKAAVERADNYTAEKIIKQLLQDIDIPITHQLHEVSTV